MKGEIDMSYGYGYSSKKCCKNYNETLSTGVLRRHSATLFLTVDAMNVDPDDTHRVTVEMFDWSSGSPVLLPLVDPSTRTLAPNQYVTFRSATLPPGLFAYEVRIIHQMIEMLLRMFLVLVQSYLIHKKEIMFYNMI